MNSITIIVADKRELFREGLAALLERQANLTVLAICANGTSCVEKAIELKPDIVIIDTEIPDENCFITVSQIQDVIPETRIFILTHSEKDIDLFSALKVGIHGYISKDVTIKRLVQTIESIVEGEIVISTPSASKMLQEVSSFVKYRDTESLSDLQVLTSRENEVLALMSGGATNKQIARALCISESTAKVHVSSILDKLHVHNRQQAVSTALQHRRNTSSGEYIF